MENNQNAQRLPAEQQHREEIDTLIRAEKDWVPAGWKMSPRSVLTYIAGDRADGVEITPKYIGGRRLVEIVIVTLVTDRALLLVGEPGTAKSWLSEYLTVAINGDSTRVVRGTAGATEEQTRYPRNHAMFIAQGPSREAMIKSPVYRAMEIGTTARLEEISHCASKVQDALISILSEKRIVVPKLLLELPTQKGFSVIATANTRDKGVNEMSAALKQRSNIVILPPPANLNSEMEIVKTRVEQLAGNLEFYARALQLDVIERVYTIFRELWAGMTLDGKQKLKPTSGVFFIAEAISLLANSMALVGSFGDGNITDCDPVVAPQGVVVKDEDKDGLAWKEYLENITMKRGSRWLGLYRECKELNSQMGKSYYFGIRHLSSVGAWHLRHLLDERKPRLVLVEGPSDSSGLTNEIAGPGTKPSIAVMALTRETSVRTILYPFVEYSPKYQAMLQARENGVGCRFIDLPAGVFPGIQICEEPLYREEDASGSASERIYRLLGQVSDEDDHETFWEHAMEHSFEPGSYVVGARMFRAQLRNLTRRRDRDWLEILVRETYTRRTIVAAVAEGYTPQNIVVVIGAYHVEGLEGTDQEQEGTEGIDRERKGDKVESVPRPEVTPELKSVPSLESLPKLECDIALMPYSYYCLSSRPGYGTGNRASSYYDIP